VIVNGGGLTTYQFALTGGSLPPGISLSASGVLSGTPAAPGTYPFTLTATSSNGTCSVSQTYSLTVTAPCFTFTVDPSPLPSGSKNVPYSETLTATGGIAPYKFSKKSGVLPPGLSLSPYGVISGTPTKTGNFSFTVLIMDETGCATTWPAAITIKQWGF
jgi:hypothetical protein